MIFVLIFVKFIFAACFGLDTFVRGGSRVWKGGRVHFVEKVEGQKKKKGEVGWVKEAVTSL